MRGILNYRAVVGVLTINIWEHKVRRQGWRLREGRVTFLMLLLAFSPTTLGSKG
jgi:hypothetical protein